MTTTPNHYHVSSHSEDDDPFVTGDLFAALDYARWELDNLADMEHDSVSATADRVAENENTVSMTPSKVPAYEMEMALLSFVKVQRYNGLMANAANMVKQHGYAKRADRAPLYRPSWTDQGTEEADARLFEAAKHTASAINSGSPIYITECGATMLTWPDTDPLHGGEPYCADEYPDGYAGYQDGPCGDH